MAPHAHARVRIGNARDHGRAPRTSRARPVERPSACGRRARDAHASNARRDALTAVRDALDRRSRLHRPRDHLADGTATVVPQRGPRGGRKLRSGVDHRMVEAPESARDDNARRDRIALCGGAAMSAAHHQAYIEEYDTAQLEIVAVMGASGSACDGDAKKVIARSLVCTPMHSCLRVEAYTIAFS